MIPPMVRLPVSPIKICAGYELYHKNPIKATLKENNKTNKASTNSQQTTTFNALEYTKQCIESVLLQTNINYELILINNGSADGTKEYFKSLARSLKPNKKLQKVTIVQSKQNLGVAKALNLGISKSIGRYVCYLNNDVIVTKDWLKKIVKAAKSDKQIGAVGTMFNAFENKDIVKLAEKDKKIIDVLAETISVKNIGKIKKAKTIHGLCMFIKKSVFKNIFDTRQENIVSVTNFVFDIFVKNDRYTLKNVKN